MRAALLGPRLRRNLYKVPTEEEKAEELMKLAANTKLEGGDSGCDSASLGDDADVSGGVSDASSTPAETLKAKKLIKRKVNSQNSRHYRYKYSRSNGRTLGSPK
jgi:hypothetical protein